MLTQITEIQEDEKQKMVGVHALACPPSKLKREIQPEGATETEGQNKPARAFVSLSATQWGRGPGREFSTPKSAHWTHELPCDQRFRLPLLPKRRRGPGWGGFRVQGEVVLGEQGREASELLSESSW